MKNYFILMVLGIVLFQVGCKKDEETSTKLKAYDDVFFQKGNISRIVSNYQITGSRSLRDTRVDSLIHKVYNYITVNNLEVVKNKIETNVGYPLWPLTEFLQDAEKTVTMTPLYHTRFLTISGFIFTDSRTNSVNIMSSRHTLKDEFLVMQQYFNDKLTGINNGLSLRSDGTSGGGGQFSDDTYTWDCNDITTINVNITLPTWNEGSNENTVINIGSSYETYDLLDNTFVLDNGTIWVFGTWDISQEQDCQQIPSTSGYTDNPFGTSNESGGSSGDPFWSTQTNTWTKCKEYYQKRMNKEVGSPVSDEAMREMIYNNCGGCLKAMQVSDAYLKLWKDNYNNPKIACHLCNDSAGDLFLGGSVLQAWDQLTFVCGDIDKDKLLNEILPACEIGKSGDTKLTWAQFAEKVKGKPWRAKNGFYTNYSAEFEDMTKLFGMSGAELTKLSDEDMCNKLNIAACLKPAAAGTIEAGMNAEKAALLDFYKNTDLVNPCTGETIDKAEIFKSLCESGEVSMSGLEQEVGLLAEDIIECTDTNPCEGELIKAHPIAAFRIWANSTHADRITIEKFGKSGWLDCSDAFRHALFNALNAIDVGKDVAKLFSDAHECDQNGNPGTGNDVEMDLYNNNVGNSIGTTYLDVPIEVIIDRVCDKLKSGQLKISTGAHPDPNLADPEAPLVNSFGCACK